MPPFVNYFIIPLILLIILVLVHELGHFLAAKKFRVYVEEFGFGIPPRVWGKRIGETLYSINALPIGGFVRLFGEEGETDANKSINQNNNKTVTKNRAFYTQSTLAKSLIISAGVFMNLALAILIFSVVYSLTGIPETASDRVQIIGIEMDSPAHTAGLLGGDIVTRVIYPADSGQVFDQQTITDSSQFIEFVNKYPGEPVDIEVERTADGQFDRRVNSQGQYTHESGVITTLTATVRADPPPEQGPLGVVIAPATENVFYPWWQMPFRGSWAGIKEAFGWLSFILILIGQMIGQLVSTGTAPEVGGPIEIFRVGGQVAQLGLAATLRFMGVLSVNLAVINILPFPALDGGRLVFVIWEGITGKKVSSRIESWIHNFGLAILLLILVLVTYNDIIRAFGDSWLLTKIRSIFST